MILYLYLHIKNEKIKHKINKMSFNCIDEIEERISGINESYYHQLVSSIDSAKKHNRIHDIKKFPDYSFLFDAFNVSDSIFVIRKRNDELDNFRELNPEPQEVFPCTKEENELYILKLDEYWRKINDIELKYETLWHDVNEYYDKFEKERRNATRNCLCELIDNMTDYNSFNSIIRKHMTAYFKLRPCY